MIPLDDYNLHEKQFIRYKAQSRSKEPLQHLDSGSLRVAVYYDKFSQFVVGDC